MRIYHNVSALNAWRQLQVTDSSLSKSLERLSSGLRINRAADDAAGLAISEKMRGQIRGLNQAIRNAQDGISLIQTAEGALQESHSILQRMRELAVQASNDTNTTSDRLELQKEVDQLAKELSRISNTTEFNTKNLLAGGFSTQRFAIGANTGQTIEITISAMDAYSLGVTAEATSGASALSTGASMDLIEATYVDGLKIKAQTSATTVSPLTGTYIVQGTFDLASTGKSASVTLFVYDENMIKVGSGSDSFKLSAVATTSTSITLKVGTANVTLLASWSSVVKTLTADTTLTASYFRWVARDSEAAKTTTNGKILTEAAVEKGILIDTQQNANKAIATIDQATLKVSAERAKLGSYQNRLEHTIANLGVSAENLTAAESRIRDVDMAQEMMEFTRNQILLQSGTAMLAQANVKPQAVLQLLA